MLLMSRYPDNYFDLAIVDPPLWDWNWRKQVERTSKKTNTKGLG
jgi:hypothetical protein